MSKKPPAQTRLGDDGADFYTVGYEKLKLEDLFALLRQVGVHCLADVRDFPWFRVAAYRKSALESRLPEISEATGYHIKYVSIPELGNPKENRKSGRSPGDMMTIYRDYALTRTREIGELYEIMRSCKTALFCYEADPDECHRSVLAAIIAEKYELAYTDLRR
jgi:uncharacterized protein (DUF488 family)